MHYSQTVNSVVNHCVVLSVYWSWIVFDCSRQRQEKARFLSVISKHPPKIENDGKLTELLQGVNKLISTSLHVLTTWHFFRFLFAALSLMTLPVPLLPRRSVQSHPYNHIQGHSVTNYRFRTLWRTINVRPPWRHLPEKPLHFCWVTSVVFIDACSHQDTIY